MRIATLIVNRNDPKRTDALVERLQALATTPQDIFVLESGSDQDKLSKYASVWYRENVNWPLGFQLLFDYAVQHKLRHARVHYDAIWMICNDAQFPENVDPWKAMSAALESKPNWGIAHPYQLYFTPGHPGFPLNKKGTGAREVSFVEFVCPLFKTSFLEKFRWDVLPPACSRGWGVDYLMSYHAYGNSAYSIYNIDDVGCLHIPNTSHINHQETKSEDQGTFLTEARKEMLSYLVRNYGSDWGDKFVAAIPPFADRCFHNWSVGDRQVSKTWKPS